MDLTPYLDTLRADLAAAAATGDPDVARAGERLAAALEPAARLALLEALAQAAAEITADLPVGTVDLRLVGRDPHFAVDVPAPVDTPPASPVDSPQDDEPADDQQVRLTLRLPESLKARAEELAATMGVSLNSWLVTAVRAATRASAFTVDIDLSDLPFVDPSGRRATSRRMTGWV